MNHKPKLTAGDYADSLKNGKTDPSSITNALKDGPLSVSELAQVTGVSETLVLSTIRSQPKRFVMRGNLVHRV